MTRPYFNIFYNEFNNWKLNLMEDINIATVIAQINPYNYPSMNYQLDEKWLAPNVNFRLLVQQFPHALDQGKPILGHLVLTPTISNSGLVSWGYIYNTLGAIITPPRITVFREVNSGN